MRKITDQLEQDFEITYDKLDISIHVDGPVLGGLHNRGGFKELELNDDYNDDNWIIKNYLYKHGISIATGINNIWNTSTLIIRLLTGRQIIEGIPEETRSGLKVLYVSNRRSQLEICETKVEPYQDNFRFDVSGVTVDDGNSRETFIKAWLDFKPDVIVFDAIERLSESDDARVVANSVRGICNALECHCILFTASLWLESWCDSSFHSDALYDRV